MFKKILFLISFLVFLGGCFWIYQNNESEKKRVLEEVNKKPLLREEVTLIIIPGDTINDIKRKLVKLEFLNGSSTVKTEDLDLLIGLQAEFSDESGFVKKLRENNEFLKDKPIRVSLEGYFPADTFRFYKNEQVEKVIKDLIILGGKKWLKNWKK
jgi:cell division protein YceG involved in septum cleavage